ncbi:MAG: Vps62-related protein [bacterium]|nr:Vps62-related protein [bacterium]
MFITKFSKNSFFIVCNLFVLALIFNGCDLPLVTEGELTLDRNIASVQIGGKITVEVGKGNKSIDTIEEVQLTYDDNYFSAVSDGTSIHIIGRALGKSDLTVQVGSESAVVNVKVHDPKYIESDGLMITYCDDFDLLWWDKGSGGDYNGSYWQPNPEEGFYALGSYGRGGYSDPSGSQGVMVVKDIDTTRELLVAPVDYEKIWGDHGTGSDMDGSFWRPIPPSEDYVAMGAVAQTGYGKPSLDQVRCVHKDLVVTGTVGDRIWYDKDTGGNTDFSSWQMLPPSYLPDDGKTFLCTGGFVAKTNWSEPDPDTEPTINVLNLTLEVMDDVQSLDSIPLLDGYERPTDVVQVLKKAIPVPYSFIEYTNFDPTISNSPFYRVEREDTYKLVFFLHNDTSVDQSATITDEVGVTDTESETYSHSTGISITAESGVKFLGAGGTMSVTINYQFGYESSNTHTVFSTHSVEKPVIVPPRKAVALYQKQTSFNLQKINEKSNWVDVPDGTMNVTQDSFLLCEYP